MKLPSIFILLILIVAYSAQNIPIPAFDSLANVVINVKLNQNFLHPTENGKIYCNSSQDSSLFIYSNKLSASITDKDSCFWINLIKNSKGKFRGNYPIASDMCLDPPVIFEIKFIMINSDQFICNLESINNNEIIIYIENKDYNSWIFSLEKKERIKLKEKLENIIIKATDELIKTSKINCDSH